MEMSRQIAGFYSAILTPFSVAAIESIVFSWFSPTGVGAVTGPELSALLGILTLCIGPFLPVAYSAGTRRTDFHVSDRNKRRPMYIISLVAYSIGVMIFWATENRIMFVLSVAYLSIGFVMMLITFAWKISAHTAATAGMATAFWIVLGERMLPIHVLTVLMIWARVRLGAHTVSQTLAGVILSIMVTVIVFVLLYV